jgi:hypothetical protein
MKMSPRTIAALNTASAVALGQCSSGMSSAAGATGMPGHAVMPPCAQSRYSAASHGCVM